MQCVYAFVWAGGLSVFGINDITFIFMCMPAVLMTLRKMEPTLASKADGAPLLPSSASHMLLWPPYMRSAASLNP